MKDRITRLDLENVRCIEKLRLDLHGLQVLIGENGSGKSTLLEAFEVLRRLPSMEFMESVYGIHSGAVGLLRQGENRLSLGVRVEDAAGVEPAMEYGFSMLLLGGQFLIERESLKVWAKGESENPLLAVERKVGTVRSFNQVSGKLEEVSDVQSNQSALLTIQRRQSPQMRQPAVDRILAALESIEVHVPFDVRPVWLSRSQKQPLGMREPVMLQPTEHLARQGLNLSNVYHQLRDRNDWAQTLELVRLGLGFEVESIQLPPDPSGGRVGIGIKYRGLDQAVPGFFLSEGQLSYLAFVAMLQLTSSANRSILCFDEPELHLHPGMISRVMDFFGTMGRSHPVILATHSDVLLNHLDDPGGSVVLCERRKGRAHIMRPNPAALKPWLKEYRGLGTALSEGAGEIVFEDPAQ
jgi:predicted ATPase